MASECKCFPIDEILSWDLPELPMANLRFACKLHKRLIFDMAQHVHS
jgi:hypothetical protein